MFCFIFRILVRAISYTVHGLIPASCVFADRYNREEVVRSLGKEVNINPPLTLGQLPDTPEELLKLDQVGLLLHQSISLKPIRRIKSSMKQVEDSIRLPFIRLSFSFNHRWNKRLTLMKYYLFMIESNFIKYWFISSLK